MEQYKYIAAGIIGFIVIFFIARKIFASKDSSTKTHDYTRKDDPNAQTVYEDQFKEHDPLSKDEKLELSWEFLYAITDKVLNGFSPEDKEKIHQIGHGMLKSGVGYEHVIEYGLPKDKGKKTGMAPGKEKSNNKSVDF
jgi:hypothetical protein